MGVMQGVRLTFDVWGETVNVAARLEQGAATNRILVSSAVLWATRGLFAYGPIRECQVKETMISGAAEVTGILPQFRAADGQPNDAFWEVYREEGFPVVAPDPAGSLRA
jgi:class 3 adenylate cyclase